MFDLLVLFKALIGPSIVGIFVLMTPLAVSNCPSMYVLRSVFKLVIGVVIGVMCPLIAVSSAVTFVPKCVFTPDFTESVSARMAVLAAVICPFSAVMVAAEVVVNTPVVSPAAELMTVVRSETIKESFAS